MQTTFSENWRQRRVAWQNAGLGLLTLLLLPSCHPAGTPDPAGPTTLRLLVEADATGGWAEVFEGFERENPGITVQAIEGPAATNTREDLYVTAFLSGGQIYDLVMADTVWIPKFAVAGWLADLTDKWSEEQWSRFLPGALEGSTFRGRIYRVPTQMDGGMLYYRRDLLEKAGESPPRSFDELRRLAWKLQSPSRLWGYVWQGRQYEGLVCNYLEVLRGYGGFWISNDGKTVGLDQPAARASLQFLVDTVGTISPGGVTTYSEEESRQLFQSGQAVFLRNWPYVYPLANRPDSPMRGKVGVVPLPAQPGGQSSATLGGWGLAIAQNSPHQEAAWKLLEYCARIPVAETLYRRAGLNPTLKEFYESSPDPMVRDLHRILRHTSPRPMVPQYAQASDILQRYLSSALTRRLTVPEALDGATRETRLLLHRP